MKKTVLFLSKGNSARSQMAEALLRFHANNNYLVCSAGTHPEPIDSRALNVLQSVGVPTDALHSKSISAFNSTTFDYVIALYDKNAKKNSPFTIEDNSIDWHVEDPKRRRSTQPFEDTFKEINERLKMFLLIQAKKSSHH